MHILEIIYKQTCMRYLKINIINLCLITLTFILFSPGITFSYNNEHLKVKWSKIFSGADIESGKFVRQTTDGGFIIIGDKELSDISGSKIYIIKTNKDGKELWHNTYGGTVSDYGESVQETMDGGFIIVGSTNSYGAGESDIYVIKTDENGKELWNSTYGGAVNDFGKSVRETKDGGFIIVGSTYSYGAGGSDVYIIKTNKDGKELWHNTYGGTINDYGETVEETEDGGFIIVGTTYSSGAGGSDIYVIKTNRDGKKLWHSTFGGEDYEWGRTSQIALDKNIMIAGDRMLIKVGNDGKKIWTMSYKECWINSIYEVPEDGFLIAGVESNAPFFVSGFLLKTDPEGKKVWYETIQNCWINSIEETVDKGFILAGEFYGDVCLIRVEK